MKNIILSASALLLSFCASAQLETYGPFVGGNAFVYKSNLYNSQDLAADSVQKYKFTPGFGVGFDFGYRGRSGVSISSGISYSTSNQKYYSKDTIIGDVLTFDAKTTMSYLKVPLVLSVQTRNDKPAKAFYSLGLFYSYNATFTETAKWDYQYNNFGYKDLTTTIDKKTIENKYGGDTSKYVSTVDQRPYRRHGWGAILGLGASKRFNQNAEGFIQFKIEYQISSSENNEEMVFTPTSGSKEIKRTGHVWGNYAKYLRSPNSNYNRPATHPFNMGLTFGLRYYLFDFE